ncbi:hypothetical protein [uncultured Roseibium sp.]|uniref:hypothetical protein n=1 Tax=uncultured Roseibium sp. TaxID=1936171 RepID=UPI00259649BD|nr:hypothetical protein [uncultured Roseibium sp.]
MADTRISNIIEPRTFTPYMAENRHEKLAILYESGILSAPDEEVSSRFNAGGRKIETPFWEDLDRDEPTIIDDSDDDIAPSNVTADDMTAYKHRMAKYWKAKTVAGWVANGNGKSPMERVAERAGAYWAFNKQERVIRTVEGVLADSVANHDGDMLFDAAYQDIAAPTAANRISPQVVNRARLTALDALEDMTAVGMHTHVYGTLLDDEKIEWVKPSDAPFRVPTYMGMQVIWSKHFPVTAGVNSPKYRCYLFGRGALMNIDHVPNAPTKFGNEGTEITREPTKGMGGGADGLLTRRFELLHPNGMSWTSATMGKANGAAWDELSDPANWTRKYEREHIKLAGFDVNV